MRSNISLCSIAVAMLALLSMSQAPAAEQESIEPKFLTAPEQVTHGFVKAGEGYFSPDDASIIFQAVSKDYLFYQIYIQPSAGGEPRLVSTGRGRTTCSYFSPDGKHILYA